MREHRTEPARSLPTVTPRRKKPLTPDETRARFACAVGDAGGSHAAGAALRISRSHVDMIAAGDRRPGLPVAVRIELWSGGEIKCADWLRAGERP